MNTLERRRIARAQLIDVSIVKADLSQSRRQSSDATKKLRKAMAANHFAAAKPETVAPPSMARAG